MKEMQHAIEALEVKIAAKRAQFAVIDKNIEPVDAKIDRLLVKQQAIQKEIDDAVGELESARGMPAQEYLDLKREYGMLCATRMQMKAALKSL